MTPTEVETYARQRYNAVSDTRFFTSAELQRYMWDAEMQLARETLCIRNTYETLSVVSQQEYSVPTRSIMVKRVSYDDIKIASRSLDEVLELTSSSAAPIGSPYIYALWNEVLYVAPLPDTAGLTIKIFSIDEPSEVTAASVLDVPTRYHMDLTEYMNWQMAIKDKNYEGASYHKTRWDEIVKGAKVFERKMLRGDAFSFVKDADTELDAWSSAR